MEFSTVQLGVDVATSLAILASAITFLINQRLKARDTKRRQLDESVRAVTVNEFQSALSTLSTHYVERIVLHAEPLLNSVSEGLDPLERRLKANSALSGRLFEAITDTTSDIGDFISSISAYKYQIYPLLDSMEDGGSQIQEFRSSLAELIESYNSIGASHSALYKEVCTLVSFCKDHPFESADHEQLASLVRSIVVDTDYRQWVDSFVPTGSEDRYWECIEVGHFNDDQTLWKQVQSNVIGSFYEKPERMQAQVICIAYGAISKARKQCKEFLTNMAAINYWLIRKGGDDDSLLDVIKRYRSAEVFAVDTEIR